MALRAEKLTNERVAKGKFHKKKALGSCLDNPRRRVEVLNLRAIHRDQVQSLLAHPRYFDLHSRLDLVHPHLVLPPEAELHRKDALIIVHLILDLAFPSSVLSVWTVGPR